MRKVRYLLKFGRVRCSINFLSGNLSSNGIDRSPLHHHCTTFHLGSRAHAVILRLLGHFPRVSGAFGSARWVCVVSRTRAPCSLASARVSDRKRERENSGARRARKLSSWLGMSVSQLDAATLTVSCARFSQLVVAAEACGRLRAPATRATGLRECAISSERAELPAPS